jgi:hypothetical protein
MRRRQRRRHRRRQRLCLEGAAARFRLPHGLLGHDMHFAINSALSAAMERRRFDSAIPKTFGDRT